MSATGSSTPTRRRRLAPAARVEMLLSAAERVVTREGVSAASMERVAREAGVSKGLMYAYFQDRIALLQTLLLREHRRRQSRQLDNVRRAGGFESMAGATQRDNWEYALARGPFIDRLMGEPAVAAAMEDVVPAERAAVRDFLANQVTDNFDVPERVARMAVMLLMGLEQEAARHALPGSLDEFESLWGAMITGAMKELERRFGSEARES